MYSFLDVFKKLKLPDNLRAYFEDVEVIKVTKTSTNSLARIYISSSRIIEKEIIYKVESALKRQVFRIQNMNVRIIERYKLNKNYNPQNIMDFYYDSILFELEKYWTLEYNILKNSTWEFSSSDTLFLHIEDSFLSRAHGEDLVNYFKQIFLNRFGFDIDVEYEFVESTSSFEEEKAYKVRRRVEEIQNNIKEVDEEVKAAKKLKEEKEAKQKAYLEKMNARERGGSRSTLNFAKQKANDDVLWGRDFFDEPIDIKTIDSAIGECVISGMIRTIDLREIRNERTIVSFSITDFTDSIVVKIFSKNEYLQDLLDVVKKGSFIKLKGVAQLDKYDGEITISNVTGIRRANDTRVVRMDNALHKRVELHCHTKMSDMDGVSYVQDIIDQAYKWGHRSIAITDHGVAQAFPDAFHKVQDLEKKAKKNGEDFDFKIIYGVEAYLVDDTVKIVTDAKDQTLRDSYVVFDIETTGFSAIEDKIIEIGAVKVVNGEITDKFSTFINPQIPIPFRIEQLTHINDQMVLDAPTVDIALPKFLDFCKGSVVVAHNAMFDTSFIGHKAEDLGLELDFTIVDTVPLAQFLMPNLNNYKLDTLTKHLAVVLDSHHRAVDDAMATADIFVKFIKMLEERDIFTLSQLNEKAKMTDDIIRKLHQYHCIILASSEMGRINLYRLISASHLQYFHRFPKLPKSLVNKYREGLIIGSACEAGELFRALVNGRSDAEIARIVSFYDYLEIQPIGNNAFMIEKEDYYVKDEEDLRNLNRKIVALGEKFKKPVVATCDVHFLNPEDEIYRRILMAGKGFDDADNQAPLYLHTTEEMLHEFDYLGEDKAFEVVVTNPNKISDMCEKIEPVRPDKRPPVIENSDEMLRKICYDRAHELYGPDLPKVVSERLERELNSIISNGYSVMYIIAQKLVWKSNDDGYLVGSRGSVGSSFAATMAGITEVNPLSPHYLCPECYYVDFDSEDVKAYAGGAGCDMPDKICPKCGHKLNKLGFDIPFETFLGFKGNKEPDIDLNFSNEYQSKAHAFTEVIFGKGQTFKAGTVGTVAEKTAYGYVLKYLEEKNEKRSEQGLMPIVKRRCEIERIAEGCMDVKRTTGQHPGGIVVLPLGDEIHSFTPVQHPANDMSSPIITTHFDYHSIDHNLLKLDILGHLDPTMIRMLQDLTGIDPLTIPLDSKEVMSLFMDTSALKIKPEDIDGCKLGALGIPEFGTDFAMQMLIDTKPTKFSDLVRIAGLSHGTDVWLGNAQELLKEGKATISTAICTRDDIMTYLIYNGIESETAFKIMEAVRKGKVAKGAEPKWEEWKQMLLDKGIPDWYIWSCEKIQYMFPKAHAAAYVMMAWRVAYCKVFYPLEFYTAFFSIRAKAFDYEKMAMGRDRLDYYINLYKQKKADGTLSNTEDDELHDMRIVQEMYARGFEFMPIDIYKAKARSFQIIDGKIMPSFKVVEKIGESAGENIEIAARDGKFLSKDDLRARAKVGQTVIDKLTDLGLLDGMAESNQLSLFDFN